MKMSLSLTTSLQQTLTPQQIQYLKLLQLPILQLEQHIRQEIEENPMLEEVNEIDNYEELQEPEFIPQSEKDEQVFSASPDSYDDNDSYGGDEQDYFTTELNESVTDPFEFYETAWQDNTISDQPRDYDDDDDNGFGFQIKEHRSFFDELTDQFRLLEINSVERIIGECIIGNLDDDGYLRRDLKELLEEINDEIIDINHEIIKQDKQAHTDQEIHPTEDDTSNPALQYALDATFKSSATLFKKNTAKVSAKPTTSVGLLPLASMNDVERVLAMIRQLDPPGVGSRSVQECLLAQLYMSDYQDNDHKNAIRVLEQAYESFTMKHYHIIMRSLAINEEELKSALDIIRHLNPKPGQGDSLGMSSTVIPDYSIDYDEKTDDIVILINDSRIPELRVNKMYERLKKDARVNKYNKDTKHWLRKKFDDAKFLLQAIHQRKITMLKVMTGIAGLQKDFFKIGQEGLRPLIYKDVADDTGLDVSTICRIVNGKFAQTPYGTFELRYFFSESLPSDDGEEISTRIVKQRIKELIDSEKKGKPMSDEKLTKELKKLGLNIARRTVAKYREQLRIPVARLRREL
jgi:RNA polymerase sigma-54 factor